MYRAVLPHLFTIGNLFCGFLSLRYILQGNYKPAVWLIVLAAVLDKMDGMIARAMGKDSHFGIEFDSLADICTFGVGPALMIYLSCLHSGWGLVIAFVYLLCGALRLARFNVLSHAGAESGEDDEKGGFYLGLPIPLAAICLTQYVNFTERTWATSHTAALAVSLVLLLSALMVSHLEYDSAPSFRSTAFWDRFKQIYFIVSLVLMIYPATQDLFFPLVMGYILSGIYRWVVSLFTDEVTQHA